MKHKKHDKLLNNYDFQKSKHLEKLATKALDNDEKFRTLKNVKITGSFLDKL